jgi:hypothetical protein
MESAKSTQFPALHSQLPDESDTKYYCHSHSEREIRPICTNSLYSTESRREAIFMHTQMSLTPGSSGRLEAAPLQSRTAPERVPPNAITLLSCFNPWRNQTDIVYPSQMAEVDYLGDLTEVQVLIALHKHDLLLPGREDLRQLGLNIGPVEG